MNEFTLANIPENEETCSRCGRSLLHGELITGQSWNGQGGEHINCEVRVNVTAQDYQDGEGLPYYGR